jgi:hypothetical protein
MQFNAGCIHAQSRRGAPVASRRRPPSALPPHPPSPPCYINAPPIAHSA